jgi:hypothetical protein
MQSSIGSSTTRNSWLQTLQNSVVSSWATKGGSGHGSEWKDLSIVTCSATVAKNSSSQVVTITLANTGKVGTWTAPDDFPELTGFSKPTFLVVFVIC